MSTWSHYVRCVNIGNIMSNLLQYFEQQYGASKPGDVTWSHAVNSREKLARFLNNPAVMFIESDIRLSMTGAAVAAHPPETESDLTYDSLLEQVHQSKQGLKLDFKDPEIFISCLQKLGEAPFTQPVLLNADVLKGNGANMPKFSAVGFIALCKKYYPAGILSIGWTTTADPSLPYTEQNIDEMLKLCEGIDEVTFPVRACLILNSDKPLKRLIQKDGYTLSIWNNEPVSAELATWLKNNTDPTKTFYDFIDEKKDPLRLW